MRSPALLFPLFATGCLALLPAPSPMHSIQYDAQPTATAKCLIVLLPGAGDDDTTFDKEQFIAAVQSRHLSVDIITANATLGYYGKGTVWERLSEDVLMPARARGYAQVWLAGISMGGLGTLTYAERHPGELTGAYAMAPFLGDESLIEEIHQAGGLAKWQAPPRAEEITEDNYQTELWRWLQAATQGTEPAPLLYLGYGTADSLAPAAQELAAALPPDHVFASGGGHDWGPWRDQWGHFLDQSAVTTGCAAAASAP